MNGHAHPTLNGHHANGHSGPANGHAPHMNGHAPHHEQANNHTNQNNQNNQNNRTGGLVDDNQTNDAHERRDDPRKDDKWGSLTRGLAAWKYHNLKEKISHKFSRGDKPDERAGAEGKHGSHAPAPAKNNAESGGAQQEQGALQPGPARDSGRLPTLNTSFRRAIHQSSQKTNLQETMETSLSAGPGGVPQQTNGLPPHYPRSPGQYRAPQPLAAPPLSPPTYRAAAPHPLPSPHMGRQHPHEMLGRGLASRRSGSYHHLAQLRQDGPNWRPHHYSVDNLADAQALPSDHTYSGPAVTGGRGQPAGGEGGGSGGSDSGRGTAGSGGEGRAAHALDTSLDSAASQRQNNQGHSSGNDSEWVDMTDAELQRIMKKGAESKSGGGGLVRRESLAATPPLPPLSPEGSPHASPQNSPSRHRKYNLSYSVGGLNKPDLLEAAGRDGGGRAGGEGRAGNSSQGSSQSTPRRGGPTQTQHSHAGNAASSGGGGSSNHRATGGPSGGWSRRKEEERQRSANHEPLTKNKNRINLGPSARDLDAGEITSTTDALDLDSMLDGGEATEATSDDDATSAYDPDVHLIRKQLEGLEGMYSEVLKLLGGGRRGGRHLGGGGGGGIGDLKNSRRRMHGSLSSLPSSIMSSRPGRDKRRVIDDRVRKGGRDNGKSIHKRFQRLESHVVTLARSVAHLSSEMRTQHLMFQEIESIRGEVAALRTGGVGGSGGSGGGGGAGGGGGGVSAGRGAAHVSWESFRAGIPGLSNPGRVKKLTQFFGDEPPLVRIFLRKLGYEKYAGLFEQEKIGMLELPYLTEERLQKIGIPMGPRLRILQEAQGPIRKEGNLSVYVV
ncbi:filaggrin-2-like isoform X2 [Penaeus chinensis]|uniref:filaggrin-2-like isoform X2 n=1 Tax=Penaeus chinensis TaxID=139456 RepID=UPI001FB5CC77|nr:filaggrin-2-like isoform X2 [Penaeus chinensis]